MALGTFNAILVIAGITKSTEKGTAGVQATIRCFPKEGTTEDAFDRTWTGWLTEKALERTLDALETMGYQFPDGQLNAIAEGKGFEPGRKFSVVIEPEDYQDKDGNTKTAERIRWINPLGGRATKTMLAKDDGVQVLAGLPGLDGDLAAWRQKRGVKATPSAAVDNKVGANFAADDIPF